MKNFWRAIAITLPTIAIAGAFSIIVKSCSLDSVLTNTTKQIDEIPYGSLKYADDNPSSDWTNFDGEVIEKKVLFKNNISLNQEDANLLLNIAKNPIMLNLMPTNISSYTRVYKKEATSRAVEQLRDFKTEVSSTTNIKTINTGIDDLKNEIIFADDDLLVIFAHSELDGTKLILPNGDEIFDIDIHKHCAEANKACVVLTCHGDDFDIKDKVTVEEAIQMWNNAVLLNNSKKITNLDFIYNMRQTRNDMENNKKIKIYISVSGTVGGTTYYYYISEEKANLFKAITKYQKDIEINPKNYYAYGNMAYAYVKLEEYDKAIAIYQKFIEINPKDDEAYYYMGLAYDELKEYDKAITAYQKAIKINPKKDSAYNNMGIASYAKKDYDKAITAFQKAIEINPKDDSAYNNLFELELITGRDFSLEKSFLEHFKDNQKAMMKHEMFTLLNAIATHKNTTLTLEQWSKKYHKVDGLATWSWNEIDRWIESMNDGDTKTKLLEATKVFKKHH